MSRYVWPYLFTLRAGNLLAASKERNLALMRDKYFPGNNGSSAIALRWSTTPNLGFPREPFQVYRRKRNTIEGSALVVVLTSPVTLSGPAQLIPVLPDGDAAYVVIAAVAVATSSSITVQAIDVNGAPIPNETVTMSQSGAVEFRCAGIAAISVSGSGKVGPVEAISENVYANLPDWSVIQTVGLPFLKNEIGASYATHPQGFWINPVTPPTLNGVNAAIERTLITAALELPPPATGIADFPLPAWPQPNPTAYIANIRTAANLVPMIERCLQHSIDTNPAQMQAVYSETVTTEGLSQIGAPPPSPPAPSSQATLPITGLAMLAVSTDPYAAVGLGYGTLDIPPGSDTSGISISIVPNAATVVIGKTQQFTVTLTGSTNNSVIWSVNGIPGGNSTVGTIATTGLYTAPASIPSGAVTVIASSVQNPMASARAPITVVRAIIPSPLPTRPLSAAATAALSSAAVAPTAATAAIAATTQPAAITAEAAAPAPVLPPTDSYGAYDYMVTAPFVFPFGLKLTLAALSMGQPPVVAPAGLVSSLSQVHAPLDRDQSTPAAIRVSWSASATPQGYGILVSRAPNQSQVLNAARAVAVGGYDVFVGLPPANPDPNTPPDEQNPAFSDVQCSLPVAAPAVNNRYLVAAQDIFGQWSSWAQTSTSLSPPPVTRPGLRNAEFIFTANSGSPPSPVIPATLRIDFGWDWQDRAPAQIRFTGQFVPAPANTLNPAFLTGFATRNTAPPGTPVILTFSYSGNNADTVDPKLVIPTITSGHTSNGAVQILETGTPPAPVPNTSQVQYRVELTGIVLDFTTTDEIDFLIYATATEVVQPGIWSDPTDPTTSSSSTSPPTPPLLIGKIVRAVNPNPPVVTFMPPPITWTTLPDATGVARGLLKWQADPSAAGYYVWEATESALLHMLPPGTGTPEPSAGTPYPTRATALKNLLDTYADASLQGFARLTQSPITDNSTEIMVPGSSETLYVYRISAIGKKNVEGARSSSVAIFAVPRRNVPGIPRILLRTVAGSPGGLQVIVLPVANSAAPAGYRLFRVRSQALAQNASTMGPAKYDEHSLLWQNYDGTTLAGNPLTGKSLLDAAAIPSWFPYYYRATAVGADDPANGLYSGESAYSSIQAGYSLPTGPPLISGLSVAISPAKTAALITLTTDLPAADASPVGGALVELLQLVREGSPPGPLKQEQRLTHAPNLITVGVINLPLLPPATIRLARSAPGSDGQWKLYMLIPYSPAEAGSFVLRLTDPLARQSTASF